MNLSPLSTDGDKLIDLFYSRNNDSILNSINKTYPKYVQVLDWKSEFEDPEENGYYKIVLLGLCNFREPIMAYLGNAWDDNTNMCRFDNGIFKRYDIFIVNEPPPYSINSNLMVFDDTNLAYRPGFRLNYKQRLIKLRSLVEMNRAHIKTDYDGVESELAAYTKFIVNTNDDIFRCVIEQFLPKEKHYFD